MIIGYITKDNKTVYASVASDLVYTTPSKKQLQRHYFANGERIKLSTLKKFINICDTCCIEHQFNCSYATQAIAKDKPLMCNSCIANHAHLTQEEREALNEERLRKQEITKTKNKSRPRDKIERGDDNLGCIGADQSKGSAIRIKMNDSKARNNTFGHNGSKTRDKMNDTKRRNGTTQAEVRSGWLGWTEEKRNEFLASSPGFLSWTAEQRFAHNVKNLKKIHNDPETKRKVKETKIKNGVWIDPILKSEYELYVAEVWKHTNNNDLSVLENYHKRGRADLTEGAYHLDHKFSIKEGFINGINPAIIGSIGNLEMLPHKINSAKGGKCSITKEELLNSYK